MRKFILLSLMALSAVGCMSAPNADHIKCIGASEHRFAQWNIGGLDHWGNTYQVSFCETCNFMLTAY
jgi:hypothetical protein